MAKNFVGAGQDRDPHFGDFDSSCCVVPCVSCGIRCAYYSSQIYNSEFVVKCEFQDFDTVQYCPATECCNAPVCFECASRSRIVCRFCVKRTTVEFLHKSRPNSFSGNFSEKTDCSGLEDWLYKIWQFYELQQQLKGKCQLFFLWLRTQKGCPWRHWDHELNNWYELVFQPLRKQAVICSFEKFLIASKMVISQTFFSRVHHIPVRIDSRRQKMLPYFLQTCYDIPFSSSFTRKQMLKEFQAGLVGTLAVRLSQSNQVILQKQLAIKIFSKIMLNLILEKK